MVKYKVNKWSAEIVKVEISRETDKSVWVKSWGDRLCRRVKRSRYEIYCDTWKEAYGYLLQRAKDNITSKELNLKYAKESLKEVLKLKEIS